jgi:uncharacterized protein
MLRISVDSKLAQSQRVRGLFRFRKRVPIRDRRSAKAQPYAIPAIPAFARLKAIDGGAKAYVHSLGEALHYEFKSRGVHVTVVPPAPTNTPVLAKFGLDTRTMPMKPMTVEQCVSEGLTALRENRSRIIPGRLNRIMNAVVPASVKRTMTAKMFGKALASKPATANIRAEA